MGRGHDHRHTPGDVRQDRLGQPFALVVADHELLGEIRQDAQPVDAAIEHEVDAAQLARQVERAAFVEDGRRNREDPAVARRRGWLHGRAHVRSLSFPRTVEPSAISVQWRKGRLRYANPHPTCRG